MTPIKDSFIVVFLILGISSTIQAGPPPPKINKGSCSKQLVINTTQTVINFGSFGVTTGGTLTINPNSSRTATPGIDPVVTSPTTAISFSVDSTLPGCEIYPVRVLFPAPTTIDEAGGATMTLQNFSSNPPSGFTVIPGTPVTVTVGADILPAAGQVGGAYASVLPFAINIRH